ncbi:MAG: hypothetical protein C3F02_00760 [Parcubacteria group bacterium]|nr:MAG: hypothetical protein C3F02_00760 [Parcubacteria group bacterium]
MSDIKKSILILEDEMALQRIIKDKFEHEGFNTVTARSAGQAWQYLETIKDIACLWVDHYLLGKESGLDFVVKVKEENSSFRNIPIFVVSNTASEQKVSAYLNLGVNKYFTKANYKLDDIISEIKGIL